MRIKPVQPDEEGFYPLPIARLATAAGMSEKMFRRHLRKAEKEGWIILRGDRVCLTVPDRLAHLIDADGNYCPEREKPN